MDACNYCRWDCSRQALTWYPSRPEPRDVDVRALKWMRVIIVGGTAAGKLRHGTPHDLSQEMFA